MSPPGHDRAGLRGEERRTRVDLRNKLHQSIRTASLPGGRVCVSLCVCVCVCVLDVHLADRGLGMGFNSILSNLNPVLTPNPFKSLIESFWVVCLVRNEEYALFLCQSLLC